MGVSIASGVVATSPKQLIAGTNVTITETETTSTINASGGGGGGTWGTITGTLSSQTDLQTALNAKLDDTDVGVSVQPFDANTVVDASYVHTDNNYTTVEQTKLAGIAAGAEVNVNADWNSVAGDSQILNKPVIPAQFNPIAGTNVSLTGTYPNITFNASGGSGSGTVVTTGSATLDFGSAPGTNFVTTIVTGQTSITAASLVTAYLMGVSTATHNAYEHIIVPLKITCSDIVVGTGFTINALSDLRLTGTFTVYWEWK